MIKVEVSFFQHNTFPQQESLFESMFAAAQRGRAVQAAARMTLPRLLCLLSRALPHDGPFFGEGLMNC
jgi:hypothetical protein